MWAMKNCTLLQLNSKIIKMNKLCWNLKKKKSDYYCILKRNLTNSKYLKKILKLENFWQTAFIYTLYKQKFNNKTESWIF